MSSVTIKSKSPAQGGLVTGSHIEILHDGKDMSAFVASVDIRLRPRQLATAELTVALTEMEIGGAASRWYAVNPNTGAFEKVRRIEFASGDAWESGQ